MPKAYWVVTYRSVKNPEAWQAYAKLAGPALSAAGGRFLVRNIPAKVYEAGLPERVVLVEFDSHASAVVGIAALKLAFDPATRGTNPLALTGRVGKGVAGFKAHQFANRRLDTLGRNLFDDFFYAGIFFRWCRSRGGTE